MRRSLGIMSGSFALRSRAFALVGHVVFHFLTVRRALLTNPFWMFSGGIELAVCFEQFKFSFRSSLCCPLA
jgi:hypothetical protein